MHRWEDEALREALQRPGRHHALRAPLGRHPGQSQPCGAAHAHRTHQEPLGAELVREVTGRHLGQYVAPEEGRQDDTLVRPVVGLETTVESAIEKEQARKILTIKKFYDFDNLIN